LVFASLCSPAAGWPSLRTARVFLIGLGIFTVASLAAGLRKRRLPDASRAVTRARRALVTPPTLAIISATLPTSGNGRSGRIWTAVGALALAVGR